MPELAPLAITIATVAGTIGLAWAAGRGIARLGLPAVLGELAAGLALGPSVLGHLAPDVFARAFSPDALSLLTILAQAAVFLFMLLVGAELHVSTMRREARGIAAIAGASLAAPLLVGALAALWIYPRYHGPADEPTAFVIFVGTALAVTALPVLSRILSDLGAQRTDVGTIAIACAAVDDLAAWTLLAAVVAIVHAEGQVAWTIGRIVSFLLVMALLGPVILRAILRPLARYGFAAWTAVVGVVAVAAAFGARAAGLESVFGPFLIGAMLPREAGEDDRLNRPRTFSPRLEQLLRGASVPLLPAFFVLIGLRTDVTALEAGADWWMLFALIAMACVVKMGAGALAAAPRLPWRKALAVGALLNTRGLVALVVLDIGRALGVLSPALFAMFVVMAFVTTLLTVPALLLIGWPRPEETSVPHAD